MLLRCIHSVVSDHCSRLVAVQMPMIQMQAKLVEFGSWCTLALYIIGSCVALHYCLELDKVVAKFVEDTPSIESLVSTALSPLPLQQIRRCSSIWRCLPFFVVIHLLTFMQLSFKDREELIQLGFMFAKSQGLLQVPTIVYIAALNILEVGYTALAKAVTNFESYELIREHENVLFLRQVCSKRNVQLVRSRK